MRGKPWTTKEIAIMRSEYVLGSEDVAKKLGRSLSSVRSKASEMGISDLHKKFKRSRIEHEYSESFADILRGYAEQGITQRLAAEILGYSASHISKVSARENIRWSMSYNSYGRNIKTIKLLVIDGKEMSYAEASRRWGVSHTTIISRVRRGWDHKRAAQTPGKGRQSTKSITYLGKVMTYKEISDITNIHHETIRKRHMKWGSIERAVETPLRRTAAARY